MRDCLFELLPGIAATGEQPGKGGIRIAGPLDQANQLFDMEHGDDWQGRDVLAIPYAVHSGVRRIEEPTAGITDSQSVKTTDAGGPRGYDAGKKIKERKHHIVTDTLGNMLEGVVHGANVQDRGGARGLNERGQLALEAVVAQHHGTQLVHLTVPSMRVTAAY